jgi:hypothetical protein
MRRAGDTDMRRADVIMMTDVKGVTTINIKVNITTVMIIGIATIIIMIIITTIEE